MDERKEHIPIDKLETGCAYELEARNLRIGIWDGHNSFHGLRNKFGENLIDSEYHWDFDERYGTARPMRKLT